MKKIYIRLLIVFLALSNIGLKAQNERFKALFIYNFTKYVEWPSDYKTGDFVIGVLGNSPISKELKIIASKKHVGSQTMKIKNYGSVGQIGKCNIIYIAQSNSSSLEAINQKTHGKPVLIITDKPGLGRKGAAINFVLKSGHQNFEINQTVVNSRKLQVTNTLYSLGIKIN